MRLTALGDGTVAVYSLKGGDRAAAACLQRFPMRHVATEIRSSLRLLSLLLLRCRPYVAVWLYPCAPAPTFLNPITLSPKSCPNPVSLPVCLALSAIPQAAFQITRRTPCILARGGQRYEMLH